MPSIKITERGWPGHYLLADRCHFRRNTLIECGERRIVVSTVGAMKTTPRQEEYEEIGHERYYETMAFRAKRNRRGLYWDANVLKPISINGLGLQWFLDKAPVFTSDAEADAMHNAAVQKIATRLRKGQRL